MKGNFTFIITLIASWIHVSLQGQTELVQLNSVYDESHLKISPEKVLFFTRAFHPKNLGKDTDPGDIWMSWPGEAGDWAVPIHVSELSSEGFDAVLGFELAGDALVYHDDGKRLQGIYRYKNKGDQWERVGQEEIPGFENFGTTFSGYLHPDGDVMVVSMQSFGTLGNEDLYIIEKKDNGHWERPINLGAVINSPFQELSPFITKDKQTLFFSSNGHGRESGTGVFVSRRLQNDKFNSWSPPKSVPGLPKYGKVTHYSMDIEESLAYFTKTVSSEHYGNLYRSGGFEPDLLLEEQVAEEKPSGNIIETLNLSTEEKLPPSGRVEPIISEPLPKTIEKPTAVDYLETLKEKYPGAVFNILDKYGDRVENLEKYWGPLEDLNTFVLKEGYMPYAIDWKERPEDISFVPAKAGNKLVLRQVNFIQGSAEFADKLTEPFLEMIAQFLTQNPQQLIQLEGHTDNFGSAQLNKDLSLKRAAKVRDILVDKGIPFDKIRVTGHGGSRPVTSNQTEEGRALNRRVELLIVE